MLRRGGWSTQGEAGQGFLVLSSTGGFQHVGDPGAEESSAYASLLPKPPPMTFFVSASAGVLAGWHVNVFHTWPARLVCLPVHSARGPTSVKSESEFASVVITGDIVMSSICQS